MPMEAFSVQFPARLLLYVLKKTQQERCVLHYRYYIVVDNTTVQSNALWYQIGSSVHEYLEVADTRMELIVANCYVFVKENPHVNCLKG